MYVAKQQVIDQNGNWTKNIGMTQANPMNQAKTTVEM
jgi:hypothetical protein